MTRRARALLRYALSLTLCVSASTTQAAQPAATPLPVPDPDPDLAAALQAQVELTAAVHRAREPFVFVGAGSGVLVSADGYILTNYHVVEAKTEWPVRIYRSGRLFIARRVGYDTAGDVALLKIDGTQDLPFATLADTAALEVGQWVLAVGDPFKLGDMDGPPGVSLGTLCARRRYQGQPRNPFVPTFYADALQTDAAVNPGNSGGPLMDLDGRLLGLTGQIMSRFGARTNSGIAYAVPADVLARFLPRLKQAQGGEVHHGSLPDGVRLRFEDVRVPEHRQLERGANIDAVLEDSPAAAAGLRKDDRIVAVDGEAVFGPYRLLSMIQRCPEGTPVRLDLQRGEGAVTLTLRLPKLMRYQQPDEMKVLGLAVKRPGYYGRGLPVDAVYTRGEGDRLQKGDLITEIDGFEAVAEWAAAAARLRDAAPGREVELRFERRSNGGVRQGRIRMKVLESLRIK